MEFLVPGILLVIISFLLSLCEAKVIDIFVAIIGVILICIFFVGKSNKIIIKECKEKAIKEYLQNNVNIQYKGVQANSTFVVTDTIITFK